jgi:hypothetical protein
VYTEINVSVCSSIRLSTVLFSGYYLMNVVDIEMKLDMIVYNIELHFKFESCSYWSLFDRVMVYGLLKNCHENGCFLDIYELILQILTCNLVWVFTVMSCISNLSFVVIDQYLTELWPFDLEFICKFVFWTYFGLIFEEEG